MSTSTLAPNTCALLARLGPWSLALSLLPIASGFALQLHARTQQHPPDVASPSARPIVRSGAGLVDLAGMHRQAELVFSGRVVDLQNVLSQDGGVDQPSLPHTFVTYAVEEVYKGSVATTHVTLRFLGGYHPERKAHLVVGHAPRFDLGDRDLLFVTGNQERITPLVEESAGRLRVLDGQLYNELGHAIVEDNAGNYRLGHRFVHEEVRTTTTVNGEVQSIDLGPQARTGASPAVRIEDARIALDRIHSQFAFAGRSPQVHAQPFLSADPKVAFFGPDFTPAGPPDANGEPAQTVRPGGGVPPVHGRTPGQRPSSIGAK